MTCANHFVSLRDWLASARPDILLSSPAKRKALLFQLLHPLLLDSWIRAVAIIAPDNEVLAGSSYFRAPAQFEPALVTIEHGEYCHLHVPLQSGDRVAACIIAEGRSSDDAGQREACALLEIVSALLAPLLDSGQRSPDPVSGFVGPSQGLRQVCHQIAIVAPSHTTVLLQGESGTGKELAARAIHNAGLTPEGPFISLNCAALPESLIESELFGHERGAFTGATKMRLGRFELANGGTLFLDEIGELGPGIQAKLLRALQERCFERLGGMNTVSFDARIVTATNRDLAKMVEEGGFRRDLYYRLNVFPIRIPPLRERQEDILPLAAHFLGRHKTGVSFSREAIELLQAHSWPGNARELENVMERAALLMGACPTLLPEHLPGELSGLGRSVSASLDLKKAVSEIETAYISNALAACAGRVNKAAPLLGLTVRELGCRIRKYGLSYKDFRPAKQ